MAWRTREEGNAWQRAAREHRRDVLSVVKVAAGCADCGYDSHPAALDFDHRPGEVKAFELSHPNSYAWPRLWAEVMKCDVVCANCHRVRTSERRNA